MKINCITKQSFTSGKITLFSDFDGTYFPEKHSAMYNLPEENSKNLKSAFSNFSDFLQTAKDDFTFKITTGRTFGEFQTVSELIRDKGFEMPLPDSFIAKNGADEYLKIGNDNDFKAGAFPFDYTKPNPQKETRIHTLTGWSANLKAKLKEILEKYNFEIIEHDSENSVSDYGNKALLSHVNYDNFELSEGMKPQSDWKAGLRKDGNLKIHLSFPYDMLHADERKTAYGEIKNSFEQFLQESDVKFVSEEFVDTVGGNRPVITYAPKMEDGSALNKLFDTKEAVKEALKNNDLIITAGDGINDYEMLNPLNYIDKSSKNQAEEIRRLPFVGIVIKGENNGLEELKKLYPDKIIEVENGHLQDGIKQAIEKYSKENSEFAKNLGEKLKNALNLASEEMTEIAEETEKAVTAAVKEETTSASKTSKGGKIAAVVAGFAAGISGIIYALHHKKQNEEKTKEQ